MKVVSEPWGHHQPLLSLPTSPGTTPTLLTAQDLISGHGGCQSLPQGHHSRTGILTALPCPAQSWVLPTYRPTSQPSIALFPGRCLTWRPRLGDWGSPCTPQPALHPVWGSCRSLMHLPAPENFIPYLRQMTADPMQELCFHFLVLL